MRTKRLTKIPTGRQSVDVVLVLIITTPEEIASIQLDNLAMIIQTAIIKSDLYRSRVGKRGGVHIGFGDSSGARSGAFIFGNGL